MANLFAVTDLVAKESLRVAHESLQMIGTVDRQYDKSFDENGGHHGSTLRVKKPNQYKRRQGSRVMDVQDQNEQTETVTVAPIPTGEAGAAMFATGGATLLTVIGNDAVP